MSDAYTIPNFSKFQDLTGKVFNRLTVLYCLGRKNKHTYWRCLCSCGTETSTTSNALKTGGTRSCGCLLVESRITHGYAKVKSTSREYQTWEDMRQRCNNPKSKNYHRYGGRGISICERWNSFQNFLDDMGERPENMSLDRIDNDKGYEPENCRWATQQQQALNTSRNRLLTYQNKTQPISLWAKEKSIDLGTLRYRLRKNWSLEKALNTPIDKSYCRSGLRNRGSIDMPAPVDYTKSVPHK